MAPDSAGGASWSDCVSVTPPNDAYNESFPSSVSPTAVPENVTFSVHSDDVEYGFSVTGSEALLLAEYRRGFETSPGLGGPGKLENRPKIATTLAFKFLHHLLDRGAPTALLRRLFLTAKIDLIGEKDLHSFALELSDDTEDRKGIIRILLGLEHSLSQSTETLSSAPSALFSAADDGLVSILLAFGGQGALNLTCVNALADLYSTYKPIVEPLIAVVAPILRRLSHHPATNSFYSGREIDLRAWLSDAGSRPEQSFTAIAAVSFPIIGLIDLADYCIIGNILGKSPNQVRGLLSGVTGHSQGLVIAAAVSKSGSSWPSFFSEAARAVELLFWMGYECHIAVPPSSLAGAGLAVSGIPTYLMAVRGMPQGWLQQVISDINSHLPSSEHLSVALANGIENYVVAGTPQSLRGLANHLAEISAPDDLDQSRVPFSKRKLKIATVPLPISAPFHSGHMRGAATRLRARFENWPWKVEDLKSSVFHTRTGQDIRKTEPLSANVAHILIDAVAIESIDWTNALQLHHANAENIPTHIIVLGGGRLTSIVQQAASGLGVRVIAGTVLGTSNASFLGGKAELFTPRLMLTQMYPREQAWGNSYKPRLTPCKRGFTVETRLSRLLNAPPVMVAGMTPTTVHWDFVAAIMKAGYHVELAGGGYYDAASLTAAITRIAAHVPTGRGITINLIYASPKLLAFQIPVIRDLVRKGLPLEGLAIGAGIPSREVIAEYIQTLGLRHISLKPGSLAAIREVIAIAKAYPDFPIILQWTGGRGGGHHSCEDFQGPLLQAYDEIRQCENLYLVVGSGFGDHVGVYPYLTGEWAAKYGRPLMPCDGILLGSRMMVAKEAHTSPQAKALLLKTPGVAPEGNEWERSYDAASAGGVLTVTSEMGQPIHKLATRGVRLWRDLDHTIFSLPTTERVVALLKRKDEIISRLNADFAKPWFGQSAAGHAVDISDMTYAEVLSRLVQLMYVSHQRRWVHSSYRNLVRDMATRTWERLADSNSIWDATIIDTCLDHPNERLLAHMRSICLNLDDQLLHHEDERFFVQTCKQRGRKPVNFIPTIDEDFETWFKKDSLWQSEDIEAVVDQDAERVCILQSPVSVRFSTTDRQSAQNILDGIHQGLAGLLLQGRGQEALTLNASEEEEPWVCVSAKTKTPEDIVMQLSDTHRIIQPAQDRPVPNRVKWSKYLASLVSAKIGSLITKDSVLVSNGVTSRRQTNPFTQMFAPRRGYSVYLALDQTDGEACVLENHTGRTLVNVRSGPGNVIRINILAHSPPTVLALEWEYNCELGQLMDNMGDRDKRVQAFYRRIWLSNPEITAPCRSLTDTFLGGDFKLHQQLQSQLQTAIGRAFFGSAPSRIGDIMPLEAAVIASWQSLMQPLINTTDLNGDLLCLVHRSNSVSYVDDSAPLRVDDVVSATSHVRSCMIEPFGKALMVEAQLVRHGKHVATVTAEFFIRGTFSDYETTFSNQNEPEMTFQVASDVDEVVLRAMTWFQADQSLASQSMQGMTLVFVLATHTRWERSGVFASQKTSGPVYQRLWNGTLAHIGSVAFDAPPGETKGNPVMDFLSRCGQPIAGKVPLKCPGWKGDAERTILIPSDAEPYAAVSGDRNPIHVSSAFACLAGLPDGEPITHGMYTAAVCRRVIEELTCEGEPERIRRFRVQFEGMVRPGDALRVHLAHEFMHDGRMGLNAVVLKDGTDAVVLRAEAEVEQPPTAYLFTGQGSQVKGMGMKLYETSEVARRVWDKMDGFLLEQYGWSILHIVRENPKSLTIHFRGPAGRRILNNYLSMQSDVLDSDESSRPRKAPLLPGLQHTSTSYTFSDARGLLFSTQFAQPAIILVEKAAFEDMRARGLIQNNAMFAGHSLGEYGALAAMGDIVPFQTMMRIIWYRGLTMQNALERDQNGDTGYGMVATNPERVGKYFDESALSLVVDQISRTTGKLLEIVNFNLEGQQYVCAGHVHAIHCLTEILDFLFHCLDASSVLDEFRAAERGERSATALGRRIAGEVSALETKVRGSGGVRQGGAITLRRGRATVPLQGIDVPFHSKLLRPGVGSYSAFLREQLAADDMLPERLLGRFLPNVLGIPFGIDLDYLTTLARVTGSETLNKLVQTGGA